MQCHAGELFKRLSTHPLMCDRYICRCYVCMHWFNVKLQREHHRLYIKDGCHPQVSEVLFASLKLKKYGCHHLGICKLDTMSGGRSDWETEGHCSCQGGLPKTCPALSSCVTVMETRIYKVKLMLICENSRNITSAKMVTEAEKANQALCEHV